MTKETASPTVVSVFGVFAFLGSFSLRESVVEEEEEEEGEKVSTVSFGKRTSIFSLEKRANSAPCTLLQ
jgi:hypothetical protein